MSGATRADGILSGELGPAIGPERCRIITRFERLRAGAVKDIVGRNVQKRDTSESTGSRHGFRCCRIHDRRSVLFRFGPVYGRPGGSVHDRIDLSVHDGPGANIRRHQVGLRPSEDRRFDIRRTLARQLTPDLSCLSEDEQPHATPPRRRPTPSRFKSGRHQSSFSRYQSTVLASPSSTVTEGRQPSSSRIRLASIA